MALRRAVQRLAGGMRRGYAESRGVLTEEEKAQENMYIRRMEKERLEKARLKAEQEAGASTPSTGPTAKPAEQPKPDPDLNTKSWAMGAALVAVLCGVYFVTTSPPGGKKTSEPKVEEGQS